MLDFDGPVVAQDFGAAPSHQEVEFSTYVPLKETIMNNVHRLSAVRPLLATRAAVASKYSKSNPADGCRQTRGGLIRRSLFVAGVAAVLSLALCVQAEASPLSAAFNFNGAGFSGSGVLTYGPNGATKYCETTDPTECRNDPVGAFAITGISGTFSDSADGITNAAITGLVPIAPVDERDPAFDPAVPASLSFTDASAGALSYDNLFFPLGNPLDCSLTGAISTQTGTFVDVFGVAFTVAGGYTAVLWGDGTPYGSTGLTYGVGVTGNGDAYAFEGVNAALAVPEPGSIPMFAAGLLLLFGFKGLGTLRRRSGRDS